MIMTVRMSDVLMRVVGMIILFRILMVIVAAAACHSELSKSGVRWAVNTL